jgi:hypothetical protein
LTDLINKPIRQIKKASQLTSKNSWDVCIFRGNAGKKPLLVLVTFWRLGVGGISTAARTGAKLANSH